MVFVDAKLQADIRAFNERGQLGPDPLAVRYAERRAAFSLFARQMAEQDIEALRPYLLCYAQHGIPKKPGEPKPTVRNYIAGEWPPPAACEHLEGCFEAAIQGEMVPDMFPGQRYWRDAWLPAGLSVIVTPMNFIWGIPTIHLAGAYLAGCPWILKLHPFAALTITSMVRAFLAAGADPRFIQKVEGFGKGIAPLATDHRAAVVAVTGSSETARAISAGRGLLRTRFEGGGCNWAWVDDGYADDELHKIAARLTYAKLGLSSHKCTGRQGT